MDRKKRPRAGSSTAAPKPKEGREECEKESDNRGRARGRRRGVLINESCTVRHRKWEQAGPCNHDLRRDAGRSTQGLSDVSCKPKPRTHRAPPPRLAATARACALLPDPPYHSNEHLASGSKALVRLPSSQTCVGGRAGQILSRPVPRRATRHRSAGVNCIACVEGVLAARRMTANSTPPLPSHSSFARVHLQHTLSGVGLPKTTVHAPRSGKTGHVHFVDSAPVATLPTRDYQTVKAAVRGQGYTRPPKPNASRRINHDGIDETMRKRAEPNQVRQKSPSRNTGWGRPPSRPQRRGRRLRGSREHYCRIETSTTLAACRRSFRPTRSHFTSGTSSCPNSPPRPSRHTQLRSCSPELRGLLATCCSSASSSCACEHPLPSPLAAFC